MDSGADPSVKRFVSPCVGWVGCVPEPNWKGVVEGPAVGAGCPGRAVEPRAGDEGLEAPNWKGLGPSVGELKLNGVVPRLSFWSGCGVWRGELKGFDVLPPVVEKGFGGGAPKLKGEEARLSEAGAVELAPKANGAVVGFVCVVLLPNTNGFPLVDPAVEGRGASAVVGKGFEFWFPKAKGAAVLVFTAAVPPKENGVV